MYSSSKSDANSAVAFKHVFQARTAGLPAHVLPRLRRQREREGRHGGGPRGTQAERAQQPNPSDMIAHLPHENQELNTQTVIILVGDDDKTPEQKTTDNDTRCFDSCSQVAFHCEMIVSLILSNGYRSAVINYQDLVKECGTGRCQRRKDAFVDPSPRAPFSGGGRAKRIVARESEMTALDLSYALEQVVLPMFGLHGGDAILHLVQLCEGVDMYKDMCLGVQRRYAQLWEDMNVMDKSGSLSKSEVLPLFCDSIGLFKIHLDTHQDRNWLRRMAGHRSFMNAVAGFNETIDAILQMLGIDHSDESLRWQESLQQARAAVHSVFQRFTKSKRICKDAVARVQLEEPLTLLMYEARRRQNDQEHLALVQDALKKITRLAKMWPLIIHSWFLSPDEICFSRETLQVEPHCDIFRATYLDKPVVVKCITLNTDQDRDWLVKEAERWHSQHHQHLVRIYGVCDVSSPCIIVNEDATGGNFAQYFKTESNRASMWKLFFEAVLGILYLHNQDISHGKLKCSNLLVGADGSAKVSDYGFQPGAATERFQSDDLRWRAPECIRGEVSTLSFESDAYSFGMSMMEAWTGKVPFDGESEETIIDAAFGRVPMSRPNDMDDTVWSLIESMTRPDPKERSTMDFAYFELKKLANEEVNNAHEECSNCSLPVSVLYRFCEACGTPRVISTKPQFIELSSNLKSMSVICDSTREHRSLCRYVTDRMKLLRKELTRQNEAHSDLVDDDDVMQTLELTTEYRTYLEQLLFKQSNIVEQLVAKRTVLARLKSFHLKIDNLIHRLDIDEEYDWNELWKLHQKESAKKLRDRIMTEDSLLDNVSHYENSLKLLEDEMIICHDQEYLPAMQFVRDAILQKMKSGYAVNIYLTKITDIAFTSKQKATYVLLQAGSETQRCKLNDQTLSNDGTVDQGFQFNSNMTHGKDILDVQVSIYSEDLLHADEMKDDSMSVFEIVGTVSIPIPAFPFRESDSSSIIGYPLTVPNNITKQKHQSMIYMKVNYSNNDSSDALLSSKASQGCVVCGSSVINGSLCCLPCANVFSRSTLTDKLPIWFIRRQRITLSTAEPSLERGRLAKVFAGALEKDSSVDVWSLSLNKRHQSDILIDQIDLWFMLNHPHILRLFGACHTENPMLCVCEHAAYGSITEYLSRRPNQQYALSILYEAALGLHYLHSQNIVHGDVSSDNIVMGMDGKTKLCNFGFMYKRRGSYLSSFSSSHKKMQCMAPERINGDMMSEPLFESDIYELGMVIIEVVTGQNPWGISTNEDIAESILEKFESFPWPSDMDSAVSSLVKQMCEFDVRNRPNIDTVVTELQKLAFMHQGTVVPTDTSLFTMEDAFAFIDYTSNRQMKQFPHEKKTLDSRGVVPTCHEQQSEICIDMEEFSPMCMHVRSRLNEVDAMLQGIDRCKTKKVDACFTSISDDVNAFFTTYGSMKTITRLLCVSQMIEKCRRSHAQLDYLLHLCDFDPAHGWKTQWKTDIQKLKVATRSRLFQSSTISSELNDTTALAEGAASFFDQSISGSNSYSDNEQKLSEDMFELVKSQLRGEPDSFPAWFVSPHEIKFNPSESFAKGSFASVHFGLWNGVEVAIKALHSHDQQSIDVFLRETSIWFRMKNPHVVTLYCACHIGTPFFVCEKASNGTLFDFASQVGSGSQIWERILESAFGLRYIQTMNVVHQDIKGNNILIGADRKSKITDFGLSISISSEDALHCAAIDEVDPIDVRDIGALPWKAPEIINGNSRGSFASDIYSFGMCILEVVSGTIPWGDVPSSTVKHKLLKQRALPKRPAQMRGAQWDLVTRMCAWDPADRLSIDQVVEKLEDIIVQEHHLEWEERKKVIKDQRRRDSANEKTAKVFNGFPPLSDWNATLGALSQDQLLQLQIEIGKMAYPTNKNLEEYGLEQPEREKEEDSCM